MITISLRIATPNNAILAYIQNYSNLKYVLRGDGRIGACTFTVPLFMYNLFNPNTSDYRVTIWRSINNNTAKLEGNTEYLTATFVITDTDITVTAYTLIELTRRRFILYPANNTTYTKFTSQNAGDIMKSIVRSNMTSAAVSLRDGNDEYVAISNLTVDANANDGISMSISCSRNNVYETLQTIATASQQAASWIVGDIVSDGDAWTFKTFATAYGTNRTAQQSLSLENGNIEQIELTYDYSSEVNFAVAAGAGTEIARQIGTAQTQNITRSPYARREYLYNNSQLRSSAEVNSAADMIVKTMRPTFGFKCSLLQTANYVRGINYNVGDILNVQFRGTVYQTRLDVIEVSVDANGIQENAELRLL
jgi:hypothetical protein